MHAAVRGKAYRLLGRVNPPGGLSFVIISFGPSSHSDRVSVLALECNRFRIVERAVIVTGPMLLLCVPSPVTCCLRATPDARHSDSRLQCWRRCAGAGAGQPHASECSHLSSPVSYAVVVVCRSRRRRRRQRRDRQSMWCTHNDHLFQTSMFICGRPDRKRAQTSVPFPIRPTPVTYIVPVPTPTPAGPVVSTPVPVSRVHRSSDYSSGQRAAAAAAAAASSP